MAIFAKERQLTPSWDLLRPSVDLLRKNLWQIIYLSFIPTLILSLGLLLLDPQHIGNTLSLRNKNGAYIMLVGGLWLLLAYPGLVYVLTQAVQGHTLSAGEAFRKGLRRVFPFVGMSLLTGICITLGFVAFIIPGLIIFRAFFLAPYYLIDQDMSPVQALKQSVRDSRPVSGWVWGVIGVTAAFSLIGNFLGYIPFIGVILSTAISYIYLFGPALRYGEITGRKRIAVAEKPAD